MFTRACHWSTARTTWIQSTPSHCLPKIQLDSIQLIICPSMPRSSLQASQLKVCMHFSSSPCALHEPNPSHPPWFDLTNIIWWRVQISSLLCDFLQSHVTSPLLGTNIPISSWSHTPSICVLPFKWNTKFHTHTKQVDTSVYLYIF
jgi:hypothetical protein